MSAMVREGPYRYALTGVAMAGLFAYLSALWLGDALPSSNSFSEWAPIAFKALTFTISAVYVFKKAFEKWVWRWKILQKRLVSFPDLTGVWFARWDSISFQSEHCSVVTIKHDFDHINVTSERRRAHMEPISDWISESCDLHHVDGQRRLAGLSVVYTSRAGLSADAAPHGRDHLGCIHLQLNDASPKKESWALIGDYWTDKPWPDASGRGGTRGKLSMSWAATLKDFETDEGLRVKLLAETANDNLQGAADHV